MFGNWHQLDVLNVDTSLAMDITEVGLEAPPSIADRRCRHRDSVTDNTDNLHLLVLTADGILSPVEVFDGVWGHLGDQRCGCCFGQSCACYSGGHPTCEGTSVAVIN